MPDIPYDVFISYHHTDEKDARKLESKIKNDTIGGKSLRVFIAPWTIQPGQNFVTIIEDALARATFVLLILSPEALKADWPTAERAAAILSDPAGRLGRVIPVLLKPCKLPPLLSFRQYVDLRALSKYEAETTKLIFRLKGFPLPKDMKTRLKVVPGLSKAEPLVIINSSMPDDVDEQIYANLFQVKGLPSTIWSAPTSFTSHRQVLEFLGRRNTPPFILKENRVFTFSNLSASSHPFRKVIDRSDIGEERMKDWLADTNYRRWLVELLNESIRTHCLSESMEFDVIGKKWFFPVGVLKSETITWTPNVRKSRRELVLSDERDGQIILFRHRAADMRFKLLAGKAYLRIDQGWVFSLDGHRPIESKRRRAMLSTRFLSRQRNPQAFTETRFWAWLLSENGKTMKIGLGDKFLEVETIPLTVTIRGGIFGDSKQLPRTVESPPEMPSHETEEDEYSIEEAVTVAAEEEEVGRTD